MDKVAIYEVKVFKGDKLVGTDIWETDIPTSQINKYYKNCTLEISETRYKTRVKSKEELEEE